MLQVRNDLINLDNIKKIDDHVKKLEEEPSAPRLLKTVRGFGYKFG